MLLAIANTSTKRKTKDLDIAIAITDWERYNEISQALITDGFRKADKQAQRFFFGDYEVDIVPYGAVAKEDDNIYWPPEETVAMSVKCFDEILNEAVPVCIDNDLEIKIVPLHGLFLLKLNAWLDRNIVTNKDAEDMWYIIDNYYMANEARHPHPEVYELDGFDLTVAGAYWMAHDIADLLSEGQITDYATILNNEIKKEEESRLIVQILETNRSASSSEVIRAIRTISDVFTNRLALGH